MSVERGAAKQFVEKEFGFATRPVENPVTDTVATTPTLILQNNPDRIFWLAMCRNGNGGAIGFTRQVTVANGQKVAADGGGVSMDVREDGESVTYEVFAINGVAPGIWYVLEIERP